MNYIATQLAAFFIIVWEVPKGAGKIGIINQGTEAGWLPVVGGQKYLLVILVVAVLTVFMYIYLNYSKHGYEIAVVGESQRTASYAGIKVERVIVRTMVLSGAVCGLMGLLLTAGTDHTLTTTIVGGRGFTAVMVSWMAKFNPIIMIFTSLLLVVLGRGASEISSTFGLNQSFSDILTGIILFFIIGSEFFITYQVGEIRQPELRYPRHHVCGRHLRRHRRVLLRAVYPRGLHEWPAGRWNPYAVLPAGLSADGSAVLPADGDPPGQPERDRPCHDHLRRGYRQLFRWLSHQAHRQ